MERLNNAYGIGVIRLQAKTGDCEVLYPAKEHELDYNMIDKLCKINNDFKTFVKKISKVLLASNEYAADAKAGFVKICDEVFKNEEEIEKYCKENYIPY